MNVDLLENCLQISSIKSFVNQTLQKQIDWMTRKHVRHRNQSVRGNQFLLKIILGSIPDQIDQRAQFLVNVHFQFVESSAKTEITQMA